MFSKLIRQFETVSILFAILFSARRVKLDRHVNAKGLEVFSKVLMTV